MTRFFHPASPWMATIGCLLALCFPARAAEDENTNWLGQVSNWVGIRNSFESHSEIREPARLSFGKTTGDSTIFPLFDLAVVLKDGEGNDNFRLPGFLRDDIRALEKVRWVPALQFVSRDGPEPTRQLSGYVGAWWDWYPNKNDDSMFVRFEWNNLISEDFEKGLASYSTSLLLVPVHQNFRIGSFKIPIREPGVGWPGGDWNPLKDFKWGIRPVAGIAQDVRMGGEDEERELMGLHAIAKGQLFYRKRFGPLRTQAIGEAGVERELQREHRTAWEAGASLNLFLDDKERYSARVALEHEFQPSQKTTVFFGIGFKL